MESHFGNMRFKLNKLPLEKAESLRQVPLGTVEPYVPLPAPVYLLMTRNQKFISLKRPFDFFTPKEIERLKHVDQLYYSDFFDRLTPFREAAREIKATLSWGAPSFGTLEPASYEISDEVRKTLTRLWAPVNGADPSVLGIESYFAVVFTNELCDPLPSDRLLQARENDIDRYELGILRSGVAVFLALHLGYVDLATLNQLRFRMFVETVGLSGLTALIPYSRELEELKIAVATVIHNSEIHTITSDHFKYSLNRASQKMKNRLTRLSRDQTDQVPNFISAFGSEGVFEDYEADDDAVIAEGEGAGG